MAGGTAVAILLKEGLLDAEHLVSLERVPLDAVVWKGDLCPRLLDEMWAQHSRGTRPAADDT